MVSNDRWTLSPDVIARRVGHSAVLIQLGTNRIYELNRTGARILELISDGCDRSQIQETILREFDVDAVQLASAVDDLLSLLSAEGLASAEGSN